MISASTSEIIYLISISIIVFLSFLYEGKHFLHEIFLPDNFSYIEKHDKSFRSLRLCIRWRNLTFKLEV